MSESASFPMPPASFAILVLSMRAQVEAHLGLMHFGPEEKPEINLNLARHGIDLLAVLLTKTKGNLELEEHRLLENSLTELRFRFVQVSSDVSRAAATPSAAGAPDAAEGDTPETDAASAAAPDA